MTTAEIVAALGELAGKYGESATLKEVLEAERNPKRPSYRQVLAAIRARKAGEACSG